MDIRYIRCSIWCENIFISRLHHFLPSTVFEIQTASWTLQTTIISYPESHTIVPEANCPRTSSDAGLLGTSRIGSSFGMWRRLGRLKWHGVKNIYLQTVILSNYYPSTSLQYLFVYYAIKISKYMKDTNSLNAPRRNRKGCVSLTSHVRHHKCVCIFYPIACKSSRQPDTYIRMEEVLKDCLILLPTTHLSHFTIVILLQIDAGCQFTTM